MRYHLSLYSKKLSLGLAFHSYLVFIDSMIEYAERERADVTVDKFIESDLDNIRQCEECRPIDCNFIRFSTTFERRPIILTW